MGFFAPPWLWRHATMRRTAHERRSAQIEHTRCGDVPRRADERRAIYRRSAPLGYRWYETTEQPAFPKRVRALAPAKSGAQRISLLRSASAERSVSTCAQTAPRWHPWRDAASL